MRLKTVRLIAGDLLHLPDEPAGVESITITIDTD
jgi:hypothetical protein